MEAVKGDPGLRERLPRPFHVGRGHVHAEVPDLPGAHPGEVYIRPGLPHAALQQPPQPRVVLAHQPGHRPHRHLPRQRHHQRLEPQREAAAGLRPRHLRLLHAARRTPHPRHPGVQVGAVLEEVQVAPALPARVVRLAAPPPARGAVERPARLEVQVQVQAALGRVELRPLHPPRPLKTQRPLEQSPLRHAAVPPGRLRVPPTAPAGPGDHRASHGPARAPAAAAADPATLPPLIHPQQRGASELVAEQPQDSDARSERGLVGLVGRVVGHSGEGVLSNLRPRRP